MAMICKSGCHRSDANAESWSNMLTRNGRLLHSVSLLPFCELDCEKETCAEKCSEGNKQTANPYKTHYHCVRAECSRLVSTSHAVTGYWKQLRRESPGRRHEGSKSLRSTSITTTPAESNTEQSTFGELAEQLRNIHESAKALADCLRTGDITGQTVSNMIEAAKHLYHKMLKKRRVMIWNACRPSRVKVPQQRSHTGQRRFPRHWTSKEKTCPRPGALSTRPCSLAEKLVEKPCCRSETTSEVFRSLSETIRPSREHWNKLQVAIFGSNLSLLYTCADLESGSTSSRCRCCIRRY